MPFISPEARSNRIVGGQLHWRRNWPPARGS